jgi:aryl-alcohol dehydrogenase-like predicted oxidoreductase
MQKNMHLGNTGIEINPLVYGTLPLGPLQANLPPEEGGELIRHALNLGVNLLDTAELYGTYEHIRYAIAKHSKKVYIASKTHAATADDARKHVERALREMDLQQIDIVHIHAARLQNPFIDRAAVFEELLKMKQQGLIAHVGLSSHYSSAILQAAEQPDIEVIHPLINKTGMGILDGSAEKMAAAISACAEAGKGVYAMKALAGGNLISDARSSFRYVLKLDGVHGIAVGMLSKEELEGNYELFNTGAADNATWSNLEKRRRDIRIMEQFCKGCGACVPACTNHCIHQEDGKAKVTRENCILCGYCAAACPEFIIRVV